MADPKHCPQCGAELPSGAPEGLCPKCLMAAGFEGRDDAGQGRGGSGSQAPTTPHPSSFVPPEPAWLADHFPQLEILELLGHGGMGAVYKARQRNLDRLVALKVIRPASSDDPAFAERFSREAKMLARLSHPQIVAVYDFGEVSITETASGGPAQRLYFFLMEYVEGPNLRQLMRTGELTPQEALGIVPQICEALQFAHDDGVVHRDIKPENILLDKRGRVKIADFGLAKLAAGTPQDFTLTATHQVMGTPRYMAPEQMEGSHAVDHRADIYSLGVVFYEMLTGEVPAGHFEPPSKKVEIDVRLDEVVLRALAREPERRYQRASEVKTEVESIWMTALPAAIPRQHAISAADDAHIEAAQQTVQFPAIGLIVVGSLLTALGVFAQIPLFAWTFGRGGGSPSAGSLIVALPSVLVIVGLPLAIIFGGLKMLRLTSRRCAITAAILAMSPIPSLPLWFLSLPIGIWALFVLAKADVKRGFSLRQRRSTRGPTAPKSDGRGDNPLAAAKPRGTLRRAWDDWWAARDRWVTNGVQAVLGLVFIVCLIMYLSFHTQSEVLPESGGQRLRHTTITYGVPEPWFEFESYPDERTPFRWKIDWISTSTGIMLLGLVAWCVNWQIEKAKAKTSGKKLRWWDGSPNFAIAVWLVATVTAVVMGFVIGMPSGGNDRRSPNAEINSLPPESIQADTKL